MVMEYVAAHGRIERKHVIKLCGISENQAKTLLGKMCDKGKLKKMGKPRRWTDYVAAEQPS